MQGSVAGGSVETEACGFLLLAKLELPCVDVPPFELNKGIVRKLPTLRAFIHF